MAVIKISKTCTKCKQELPSSAFAPRNMVSDGLQSWCKGCTGKYAKNYQIEHRDDLAVYHKTWYEKYALREKPKRRTWHLQKKYGLSHEEWLKLWDSQEGSCAICSIPFANYQNDLNSVHTDHDHETGKIRGLLCRSCNVGIGCFNDDLSLMARAVSYLENKRR